MFCVYANPGPQLREIRLEKGLKQQEVCERCHIDQSLLSKIENGKIIPRCDILFDILDVLGCVMVIMKRPAFEENRGLKEEEATEKFVEFLDYLEKTDRVMKRAAH